MPAPSNIRRGLTFGYRVPLVVGVLISAIAGASIISAVAGRQGAEIFSLGVLLPSLVWRGEVWRLASWTFFESDPISLIFACLMLYWFGKDLALEWGTRHFLRVYFGLNVGTAMVLCLIAKFVWPPLMERHWVGGLAVDTGLVIAWALTFPDRQMFLYFVLRIGGMSLVYLTLGLTVLFALFYGLSAMLHEFAAEILILAYMYRRRARLKLRELFLKLRGPRKRKGSADIRVWDDKQKEFRKPKWMN